MRYRKYNESKRGLDLLRRISNAFVSSGGVYESYDMLGRVGTDNGSDYLEHCAGFIWSVTDGPFGFNFDSDTKAAATITPRFDPSWRGTSANVIVRGVNVSMTWTNTKGGSGPLRAQRRYRNGGKTTLIGHGGDKPIHIRLVENGESRILTLGGSL